MKVEKDSLHKVVKNASLNYDELITVLIEIEAMFVSRALACQKKVTLKLLLCFICYMTGFSSRNEFNTARCKHWRFDESSEICSAVTDLLLQPILQRINSCSLNE